MADSDLGSIYKVYKPGVLHLWFWGALLLAPLSIIGLIFLISLTGSDPLAELWNFFVCLGGLGLLMVVLTAMLVSDLRAWAKHRSVRLTLYSEGFVYESKEDRATCAWSEIQDIRYKKIRSTSKAFLGRSIRVIGSIVKADGTAFVLPEVLPLAAITEAVSRLRKTSE